MLRFHGPYYELAYALMDFHPVFEYVIPTFGFPSSIGASFSEGCFQCRWDYEDVKPLAFRRIRIDPEKLERMLGVTVSDETHLHLYLL